MLIIIPMRDMTRNGFLPFWSLHGPIKRDRTAGNAACTIDTQELSKAVLGWTSSSTLSLKGWVQFARSKPKSLRQATVSSRSTVTLPANTE